MITSLACIGLAALCFQDAVAQQPVLETPATPEMHTALPLPEFTESIVIQESISPCAGDRIFLLSTRHLSYDACRINLDEIPFRMWQLECGTATAIDPNEYQATLSPNRPVVIYVHGNRMPRERIVNRATSVRNEIKTRCQCTPTDWIIFSWPSRKEFAGVQDFREKADRCDAQGLYLASFMRKLAESSVPMAMIGYSFGARVATGSLHALAGGQLSGRRLPEGPLTGANVRVGLVAPAIESTWLGSGGYHGSATQNMNQLVLLYNRRDAVLKRYWLLEKVRRETALGFSGPTCFAPRVDGTRLPVRSRDCSPSVRIRHSELDYYRSKCNAGCDMARLINEIGQSNF